MLTHETFTAKEQALLAPFVTNTDRSVFVLTQLPEVIKGALFSRYSRSTLGLRTLLLKDFLQNEASGFTQIPTEDEDQRLAIQKAQDFYDRILDGYGDDSIGELGGAHLALENVSMLATKVLEDARIGGSPLEKSTRYVSFAQQVNGDYLFFKEPRLLASEHAERYLEINRHLFRTYAELIEPLREHVRHTMPREADQPEAAYERSVRAQTFDLLRGLLPASTLTNMGIFGNGRFFESLLTRLRCESLFEMQALAEVSYEELAKVIPSFVRRAESSHRHFQSQEQFHTKQQQRLQHWASTLATHTPDAPSHAQVTLSHWDPDAENKIFAALLYQHSELSLARALEMTRSMSTPQRDELLRDLCAMREHRRHKPGRAFEQAFFTFDVVGDYGAYRDLQRHRMLTQTRQRLTTRLGFHFPEEFKQAGQGEKYADCMQRAADSFEFLQRDFPQEAQYVVPMAYHIRWSITINLRALMWLVELRTTPQGHESYRWIAQEMFRRVQEVQPRLAQLMKFVDLDRYSLGRIAAETRQENKSGS